MSTTRLDPRERVEQSQLAAALAASRQVEATPQQQPLPPPSATKYGDLGSGTLLTTTTETTATSTSGSAQGKVSEDRLGLLSSLGGGDDSISRSNERRHIDQQTTPRMLSSNSTRPSARAPKRTLIDEDGDLSLPPAAALNAAAHELGSAHKTNIPAANDTIMADDTAEVIGDSDEESRRELTISPHLFLPLQRARQTQLTLSGLHTCSVELHPFRPVSASRRQASRASEHGHLVDRRSDRFVCRSRSEQTVQGEPHVGPDRHDDNGNILFFAHRQRVETKEHAAGWLRPQNRGRSEPT